ncbi:hypothetical protein PsYK624_135260 [Phanerochaete sordida]|uniref:Uncharacterized protein n=1 Tax=Phanerochaete sordida TaxID=48140 RepID=A0A9P3GL66_9APHY|nr:hypothetical protein PsYK624_135260 [Phanerochaete sordida]
MSSDTQTKRFAKGTTKAEKQIINLSQVHSALGLDLGSNAPLSPVYLYQPSSDVPLISGIPIASTSWCPSMQDDHVSRSSRTCYQFPMPPTPRLSTRSLPPEYADDETAKVAACRRCRASS